jgi:glycosyltransferase involved in cell wall biosynthesis
MPAVRARGGAGVRILLLAPHPFFTDRGTPIAVRGVLEGLAAEGHELTVLTYHQGRDVRIPNCTIHRIPAVVGGGEIRPGFSLRKLVCDGVMLVHCAVLLRRQRFDLIHAVEESAFIAVVMQWLHRVPFVYDMDSSVAQQMVEKYPALAAVRRLLEACERHAVRDSVGVLAVCQALVDTALAHAPGQLVAKLEDVSLLGESAEGGEDLRETIGFRGPIVMYVGNLEPYQGIELLVESFARALGRAPAAHLVVIGGTEADVQAYRARCRELGVETHAHFLGPRPVGALGHYLRQADVLVSPRIRGTNTAMKVYSYLDSGRPLVATRLLTHTQVLDDTIARLAEPEPEAMAHALVEVLTDETLGKRLVRNARERVAAEYSPAAFRRKLSRFYGAVEDRVGDDGGSTASRGERRWSQL